MSTVRLFPFTTTVYSPTSRHLISIFPTLEELFSKTRTDWPIKESCVSAFFNAFKACALITASLSNSVSSRIGIFLVARWLIGQFFVWFCVFLVALCISILLVPNKRNKSKLGRDNAILDLSFRFGCFPSFVVCIWPCVCLIGQKSLRLRIWKFPGENKGVTGVPHAQWSAYVWFSGCQWTLNEHSMVLLDLRSECSILYFHVKEFFFWLAGEEPFAMATATALTVCWLNGQWTWALLVSAMAVDIRETLDGCFARKTCSGEEFSIVSWLTLRSWKNENRHRAVFVVSLWRNMQSAVMLSIHCQSATDAFGLILSSFLLSVPPLKTPVISTGRVAFMKGGCGCKSRGQNGSQKVERAGRTSSFGFFSFHPYRSGQNLRELHPDRWVCSFCVPFVSAIFLKPRRSEFGICPKSLKNQISSQTRSPFYARTFTSLALAHIHRKKRSATLFLKNVQTKWKLRKTHSNGWSISWTQQNCF